MREARLTIPCFLLNTSCHLRHMCRNRTSMLGEADRVAAWH
jgi:hypothetical protein